MVHPGSRLAAQLQLLQALPWSLQAVAGCHLHRYCQALDDPDCVLPLISSETRRRAASAKASWGESGGLHLSSKTKTRVGRRETVRCSAREVIDQMPLVECSPATFD